MPGYIWLPEYERIIDLLKHEVKHELPMRLSGSYVIRIPDELKQVIFPLSEKKSLEDCWVFICLKREGFGKGVVTDYYILNEKTFRDYWFCPTLGAYASLNKFNRPHDFS